MRSNFFFLQSCGRASAERRTGVNVPGRVLNLDRYTRARWVVVMNPECAAPLIIGRQVQLSRGREATTLWLIDVPAPFPLTPQQDTAALCKLEFTRITVGLTLFFLRLIQR